jgi:DNA/RNA-binding domain of Phe-tRNA-synthetase-like protein
MLPISVSADVRSVVALGALTFERARILDDDPRLNEPLARAAERMRGACGAGVDVAAVRAMYKRLGVDPTKTRPSSEALLRRVRKGDPLPRINTMVDICNWCSLELQLPYGLYDLDRLVGPVALRLGEAGEEYAGIRKDSVHVAGRLTLADQEGPFGNPTSDSARTMVTSAASRVLIAIFAPAVVAAGQLEGALEITSSRAREYTGAVETGRWMSC